jgi:6,7-dimethyl-8-ribityllumazine synthase
VNQPPEPNLDGSDVRIAIVVARFNEHVTLRLLDGALAAAEKRAVKERDVFWAPGSFELPVVAMEAARSGKYDAVVCLGAVIRHVTDHYLHVATQAAAGIARVSLDTGVPCMFAVLTCDTDEQALERSSDQRNEGRNTVEAAIATVHTLRSI